MALLGPVLTNRRSLEGTSSGLFRPFLERLSEKSRDAPRWGSQTSIKQDKEHFFLPPRPLKRAVEPSPATFQTVSEDEFS
jgi:hypothetical protein